MATLRHKPRRKFQHQPTNIEELCALFEQPSTPASRRKLKVKGKDKGGKGKGRSKSASRFNPPSSPGSSQNRFQNKSKSAPALTTSSGREEEEMRSASASRSQSQSRMRPKELERDLDLDKISVKVGSLTYEMDGMGEWSTSVKNGSLKEEALKLRKENRAMFEENNLLRVKNELLLDMIAKKTLRISRIENDLKRLRKVLSSSSSRFSLE